MLKKAFLLGFFMVSAPALASQMTYGFSNPQFSGDGYGQHVLTIENLEASRKASIEAEKKAKQTAEESAKNNTNLAKFLNNLESRIYAQLSLQLSNAMFADGNDSGTMSFEGSTISWIKDAVAGTITLTVIDSTGNRTEITVPIGDFKF